jgi:polyisoprenoid-binding protein YceI
MKKINFLIAFLMISIIAGAQDFSVNTAKSELKWKGKKVTGEHWGYVKLKDGTLSVKDGKITGGVFNIDMNSLINKDLEDPEWNGKLIGHLKSDDFFSVETFPVATLTLTESTPFKDGKAEVKGKLTIKGITNPVSFTANKMDDGYTATIIIDRTKYDVRYGSGKFFDNLGDNMIYDDFTLDVKIAVK